MAARTREGTSGSRIPATLQMVFLTSNRGKTVNKPPPERVAYKVFLGNWVFKAKNRPKDLDNSMHVAAHEKKRENESQHSRKLPKRTKSKDKLEVRHDL